MSKFICIMGESGNGKTTSLRNLPAKETVYIDADGKGLSWKGWRKQYNTENKNYYAISNPKNVLALMKRVDSEMKNIHYLVIDTLNTIMANEEMLRMQDKGYDKWIDLAQSVWGICRTANALRSDLTVIVACHVQTDTTDDGYVFTHIKTNGKKLNKLCLESLMPVVLFAKRKDGRYVFETQANNSTAKSPMGAFDSEEIENDIMLVIKGLGEY